GIGTAEPTLARLEVVGGDFTGVYSTSSSSVGVRGNSDSHPGVYGVSDTGVGVRAHSNSGNLVEGDNGTNPPFVRRFHIDNNGTYTAGSDFAEALPVRGGKAGYEPGDVLIVSEAEPGTLELAQEPADPRVAGVYSTRPGVL